MLRFFYLSIIFSLFIFFVIGFCTPVFSNGAVRSYVEPERSGFDKSVIGVLIDKKKYQSDIRLGGSGVSHDRGAAGKPPFFEAVFYNKNEKRTFLFCGEGEIVKSGGYYCLINYLKIEDYIACVLISEFERYDYEAWRALAVLVRTMVYKEIIDRKKMDILARHPGESFFLLCARTHCASYRGVMSRPRYEKALKAVRSTVNSGLFFDDSPVDVFYSACCGGKIIEARDIYHKLPRRAYLEEKKCPCETKAYSWKNIYNVSALNSLLGFEIKSVKIMRRPYYIIINEKMLYTFDEFISRIEKSRLPRLKSPFFNAYFIKNGGFLVVEGAALGHCAGLCMAGALKMAGRGSGYKKILNYYYKSCNLKSVDL